MPTIVTLTMNPAVDSSTRVEHVVAERKLRCGAPRHDAGGGGINVSRAIHILGGESTAVYPLGGWFGRTLKELLDREGIAHRPVPIEGTTRQGFTVLEQSSGRQFRFGMPGPMLNEGEWMRCIEEILSVRPTPQFLVASGSLPPGVPDDFYARVGAAADEMGAHYIVDTSGRPLRHAVRANAFLLKPNMRELGDLSGQDIEDEAEQEEAVKKVLENGECEAIVVSLGAAGALMATREGIERFRAPTVPIKSKVGAGDCTVAGMTLGLARGWPLREAVRFGVATGSAAVMTPGTELCRREDAERLYERMAGEKPGPARRGGV
ncbi:MAG: 1-phosphofructokinase family hexose kinase [Candidatus Abyssubacteria bacterium]